MTDTTKKLLKIFIPIIVGVIIALIEPPEGLTREAMIYMGIFECVVVWLLLDVVPDWAAFLACIACYAVFNVAKFGVIFAPFADTTIWLLIGAFGISAVLVKTGLVKRIAFSILRLFPENFRGQITAFYTTGLIITPFIPALIGKGVILSPIAASASKSLGYKSGSKAATGLFLTVWVTSGILGYAFLTGAAPAMITVGMLPAEQQANWTWTQWFLAAAMWFVVTAVLSYIAILVLYNPKRDKDYDPSQADTAVEKGFAKKQLEEMGPMSGQEKATAVLLVVAILGWIFGSRIGINAATVSVTVLAIMAVSGLITTQDFVTRIPWDTVIFIGGILSLASLLTQLGISTWIATLMGPIAEPVVSNPYVFIIVVCVLTYLLRFVVVSSIATQVIFLAALGTVAAAAGINPWVLLFVCGNATDVWHFKFTNNVFVPILGATKGEMCSHNDTMPYNVAFMVINLIACLASVPIWQMMGLM